jgi:hypothetical protein
MKLTAERQRLDEQRHGLKHWRLWGPYLSDRQWGTVREDYSADGSAWTAFPHDHARSRAYRWGEDGIAGVSDDQQRLCFSLALWNGRDAILKERLFGLTGPEGNHGEDCKELYYHLDATPTHSYLKMLYKYPQAEFPYARLVEENRRRGKQAGEYELIDTGALDDNRYFDVFVEYAKLDPSDLLIRVTVHNRGADDASLHLVPQAWFRNTWSWGRDPRVPSMRMDGESSVVMDHPDLGRYHLYTQGPCAWAFCDNQTNSPRLYGTPPAPGRYYKDGLNDLVVHRRTEAVNPDRTGTKVGAIHELRIQAASQATIRLRLSAKATARPFDRFDARFEQAIGQADEFYESVQRDIKEEDARRVQRQALAGMIWSKQFYHLDVPQWLEGDPAQPTPPAQRRRGRNAEWSHINHADVLSMPDKWEYPWYAAWDLAFHCLPLARVDPEFAKHQLVLLTREWYMHPNGQLPAYEWAFGDVNPPVHAWATWKVYQIDRAATGRADTAFLERVFHKLLLNFNWWVNRKDMEGRNVFQGGFLGMDNVGVFDRSAALPTGGYINQADGTAWMGMYCLNMLRIALELARTNPTYQDMATKFFEHFLYIASAMNRIGATAERQGVSLWCDQDEFFYDVLCLPDGSSRSLKVRSMVGLIPLLAVEVLDAELLEAVPEFKRRMDWFLDYRPDLAALVSRWSVPGKGDTRLLSLLRGHRMKRILHRMLDEQEFLSPHGVRSLSRHHLEHPYHLNVGGRDYCVRYLPGESDSGLFGGNSNWRGPIWMPVNFLLVDALRSFDRYYGPEFQIECPTGSGRKASIGQVADELTRRLAKLFLKSPDGHRAVFGDSIRHRVDPHFRDYVLFHEYFDGESGRGVGASHQTGWTGLIAELLPKATEVHHDHEARPRLDAPAADPRRPGRARRAAGVARAVG